MPRQKDIGLASGSESGDSRIDVSTECQQYALAHQFQRLSTGMVNQDKNQNISLSSNHFAGVDPALIQHTIFTSDQLRASQLNPNPSIEKHPSLGIIVQARMGSSRLPGKVAKIAGGKEYLSHQLDRILTKCPAHRIVVATRNDPEDDVVCELAKKSGVGIFRGSSQDVLKRYIDAAEENQFTDVVRITGDSPVIDPFVMDEIIRIYGCLKHKRKYVSNTLNPSFPLGFNVEITSLENLQTTWCASKSGYDHEHVTPYIKMGSIRDCVRVSCLFEKDLSMWRFTLDTTDDHLQLSEILSGVSGFEMECVLNFAMKNRLMRLDY